jgi:hypothetical protein
MDIQFLSASVKETAPARGASWGHLSSDAIWGISIWSYLPSHPGDIRSGGLADLLSEHAAHLIVLWNRNDSPAPAWSIGVEMAWEKRRAKQATRVPI